MKDEIGDKIMFCPFEFSMQMQTMSGSGRTGICHSCHNVVFHNYQDLLEQDLLTSEELKQLRTQTIALERNLDRILREFDRIDRGHDEKV